mmetsp:Transcript_43451/g.75219  ORF Transcript_43451/g.75219 Transcript_43451/m.75219 type:complete len:205 (+) Transcript_43451:886-1500(+)
MPMLTCLWNPLKFLEVLGKPKMLQSVAKISMRFILNVFTMIPAEHFLNATNCFFRFSSPCAYSCRRVRSLPKSSTSSCLAGALLTGQPSDPTQPKTGSTTAPGTTSASSTSSPGSWASPARSSRPRGTGTSGTWPRPRRRTPSPRTGTPRSRTCRRCAFCGRCGRTACSLAPPGTWPATWAPPSRTPRPSTCPAPWPRARPGRR